MSADPTVNSIVKKVDGLLLEGDGREQVDRLVELLAALDEQSLTAQVRRLGRRPGVEFYASVGGFKKGRLYVDARIRGNSCGAVELVPSRSERWFRPAKTYASDFPVADRPRRLEWKRSGVREYLARVRPRAEALRSEREVESALLQEMAKTTRRSKQAAILHHQPVVLATLPFQFPLPISARKQIRVATLPAAGHADVVARFGARRGIRVFEVKKPGASDVDHALDQAVAYCAAFRFLLDHRPKVCSDVLGFSVPRPALPIEAVAFIHDDDRGRARDSVRAAAARLGADNDYFNLYVMFYRWSEVGGGRRLSIPEKPLLLARARRARTSRR